MKLFLISIIIFTITLAFFSCAEETGKVDFSGEWSLNRDMSDFGDFAGLGQRGEQDGPRGEREDGPRARGDRAGRGARGSGFATMIIKQTDNMLTVERPTRNRDGEEISRTTEMRLDGKEFKVEGFRGNVQTSTAKWTDGGMTLTVTTTAYFERDGEEFEMKSSEKWLLEENGAVLAIESNRSTPRGDMTTRMVYDKKE